MATHDEIAVNAYRHVRKVARRDFPVLAGHVTRLGPIKVGRPAHRSLPLHLCGEIVAQQLSFHAADAIWGRLKQLAAAKEMELCAIFADAFDEELRGCGVSRNKIKALKTIRAAELEGKLDKRTLARLAHDARSRHLTSLWGVGQWTADMIGISFFRDPDIWPEGDVAAVGSLRRVTGRKNTVATAALFAPYRSYLARYAWQIKDATKK